MLKKTVYFLVVLLIIPGLLSGCAKVKTTQNANDNIPPLPIVTREDVDAPAWRQVESAISDALLGTGEGKCEWEVWGWLKQERFIWAFCQEGPELNATAASMPLVVRLASDGSVETIHYPQEGTDYTFNVKGLFPPAVQEKIFANEFDLYTAVSHLETRWNYPSMPPAIYSRAGEPLPRVGAPVVQAISAATVDSIASHAVLGQGNVKHIQYLPDGGIVAKGDLGFGLIDLGSGAIQDLYQDILSGREGFLSSDGKLLAAVNDHTVTVYETSSQAVKISIDTHEVEGNILKVQFLADGLTLVVEKNVPSEGFSPSQVALYQLGDGTLINRWQLKGGNIVLSPDGWVLTSLYDTSGLQLWSVVRGELMYTLPDIARAVSFSGDGQIMAVVGMGKVQLFWVWDGFEIGRLQKNIGTVSGVALSPDGKLVLTWSDGPYPAQLWRVPEFEPVATLDIQAVTAAAFNQDGSSIVLAGNSAIGVYDVVNDELMQIPSDTYYEVAEFSFAPNRTFSQGQRLAVLYRSGVITNWDITSENPLFVRSDFPATSLVYLPEPYGIAAGTIEKTVLLFDEENGSPFRAFEGFKQNIIDLAMSPTDKLAAGSMNEVRIYSLANQDERFSRDVRISGGWVDQLIWPCHLIAQTADGTIHLLDHNGEEVVQELGILMDGYETSLAFLPDCSQLIVAANNQVFRWRTADWQELEPWTLPGYITSLDISQDGSLGAVGHSNGSVTLLDSTSGAELKTLQVHAGRVSALEFSPDGRFLATGGSDGLVMIWGVK